MVSQPHNSLRLCPPNETLWKLLSDGLDTVEESQVAGHLEGCSSCQEAVERQMAGRLSSRGNPSARVLDEPPPALKEMLYGLSPAALLDSPDDTGAHEANAASHLPGRVGRFLIERRLGEGGFGVVLLAYDPILKRQVALKLARLPRIVDGAQEARFLREARAAAGLHHPNIVPVHEAGQADGLHYLAADYCPGPNLAQWFAEQAGPLPPKMAARIVRDLAGAVEHAHQSGVLHRDIKPGNVLLDPRNSSRHTPCAVGATAGFAGPAKPQAANGELPFTPKLTDFGLAKLINGEANASQSGLLIGTPRYMAPEQASGERDRIGPRSDVYALGVVLYELLTRRPPIQGEEHAETLRRLLSEEPLPPRRHVPTIPHDLEAICLKCLEKSPQRRYTTAGELAADLTRFLAGESTQARPFRWHERLARMARRAPAVTALVATIVGAAALLIVGLAMHLGQVNQLNSTLSDAVGSATAARKQAERQEEYAGDLLYASDIASAHEALQSGDVRQTATLLARHVPQPGKPDRRGFEWHYLHRKVNQEHVTIDAHEGDIYMVRYSPDGRRIATCGKDGFVRLWDTTTLAKVQEFDARQGEVNSATFSPDRRRMATTGDDGSIVIWDLETGRVQQRVEAAHGGPKTYLALFFRDGKLLASCGNDNALGLWSADNLTRLARLEAGPLESLALSKDGRWLASAAGKPEPQVLAWDLNEFNVSDETRDKCPTLPALKGHEHTISGVAFSPAGDLLASCDLKGRARIWVLHGGSTLRREIRALDPLHAVDFSPDGISLAAASRLGSIHVWPVDESASADTPIESSWKAHEGRAWTLSYSSEVGHLASGGADGKLKIWPYESPIAPRDLTSHHTHDFVCIPGTSQLLCSDDPLLSVYELDSGTHEELSKGQWGLVTASADGHTIAATPAATGWLCAWKRPGRQQIAEWPLPPEIGTYRIRLSPCGDRLAALTDSGRPPNRVRLFETASGQEIAAIDAQKCHALEFSPAGGLLAYNEGTSILLSSAATLERVAELRGHGADYVLFLTFSPDGRWLASAGKDRLVKVWDVATGREIHSLDGQAAVEVLAFSPDGRTLASGAEGEPVRLWHVATGQKLFELDIVLDEDGPLQFVDNGRLAFRRPDHGLSILDVGPSGGDRSDAGRIPLVNGSTQWTWNALPKPSNRVLFARAGTSKVHVDKESAACELLKVSQGEVDLWLAGDCLVQSASPEPPSPSIDIGQANSTGAGATLRLHGPGRLVSKGVASIGEQRQSAGTVIVGAAPAEWPGAAAWDLDGELYLGKLGAGTLRIEGGGRVSDHNASLGGVWGAVGGSGTATVTGSGTQWIHKAGLNVGYWGVGTLDVTQGGIVSGASGHVGYNGQGTVTISGAGSQWRNTRDVILANRGPATMKIEAGGIFSCRDGTIGNVNVATVTITGGGSRWSSSGNLYVTAGTLDISRGGQVTVESNVGIGTQGVVSAGPDGALRIDGTITNSGRIEIAAGGMVSAESVSNDNIIENNGTLTGDLLNLAGGGISGGGRYSGTVTVGDGSSVLPAVGLGTMLGQDFVFGSGAKLWWEINNATGKAGHTWDLLSLSGNLKITATAENPFIIELLSLDATNAAGLAANFDSSQAYSWKILHAEGGIVAFSSDKFRIATTRFRNRLERGAFSISQKGNGLYLNFAPAGQ